MALTPLQKVRYKTTSDETLLPDSLIQDFINENTVSGVWNFEATLADVFDYLASTLMGGEGGLTGTVKSVTVGVTSVTYASTFADAAAFWRMRAGMGGKKIVRGSITREDYAPVGGAEFGND